MRRPRIDAVLLWIALGSISRLGAAQSQEYAGACSDCHGDFAKRGVVHSPIETGACTACHEEKKGETHKFKLVNEGAKLCIECHEEEKFRGKSVHSPVTSGQCLACHDPHGSKAKGLLRFESVGAMCGECHTDTMENLAFQHGPAAIGQCTTCHVPHAGDHAKLLRNESRALCLECHDDVKERLASVKHVHQPVENDCSACHRPHGAGNKALLTQEPPQLCLDCHEDITGSMQAACKHSPVTTGAECGTCHDSHGSAAKGLLTKATASDLCLSCHSKETQSGGRTFANLAAHLTANPHHHGPVASGDCAACHNAHGSQWPALALHSYPGDFYAAFTNDTYKLCFECHDAAAFESSETEDATEFRNGTHNLHFVHVNKAFKGRTCGACHDPHASKNDKHIADGVRFGKWTIPLNFRQTPQGGSCGPGCHQPYRYDRVQPVANIAPH